MSRERNEPDDPNGRPLPPRLDPRAGRPPRAGRRDAGAPDRDDTPAGARPRARRLTTALRVAAAVLAVAVLATSGRGWYLFQVAEASVNRTDAIPTEGNEDGSKAGAAMNLLLVGNDSRANLTDEQLGELQAGKDSGINTDTMILVHVPADGSRASFVSFPRDSYVEIPGYGEDKLNAAYAYGYQDASDASEAQRQASGAQLLVKTISSLTGLQIDHYAEVDLLGFFNLTSVVGGVEVNLCEAVDDSQWSGAVFPAGPQTISGADALKFVRQRHGLPRGDFDRIIRQQVFIAGVLRKMLSDDVLFDLGKQQRLVKAAAESLTLDQSLNLFSLAEQMQSVDAGDIEFQTIPYIGTDRDDADRSIIRLEDEDVLHAFFGQLSGDRDEEAAPEAPPAPETVAPAEVTVEVLNGSGTSGLAGSARDELVDAGFVVDSTGNADSMDYEATEIRFAEGDDATAGTLAAAIPGAVLTPSTDLEPGVVTLVLGSNFNGIGQPVTVPEPTEAVVGEDQRTASDTTCIN